jgi:tripartite-type tricarboxylate transporter receptor subunit TctC
MLPKAFVKFCAALALSSVGAFVFAAGAPAKGVYQSSDKINLIVGYEAGGGYDIYARFIAQFLSKHLPGNPRIIVQNMPGAGSLKAANYLYNIAPKDGSVIGIVSQSVPQMELLAQPGIQFQADKFNWIGRVADVRSLIAVWHGSPVKTMEEAKQREIAIAVGGPISGSTLYVSFLNALTGTKMRPITGYGSREAMLAMERGEIDGSSSILWSTLESQYPNWIQEKKIRVLTQIGSKRDPKLADVPLIQELAGNDQDRKILEAIASSDIIGRSLLAPPGIPQARRDALRKALTDALNDPEVQAAAKKMKVDIAPMDGIALQKFVHASNQLPADMVAKIRQLADSNNKK